MTNAQVGRVAALGLIAVSCAALAACSSGPSPAQQARSTRAAAMAAGKDVHQELSSVPIAYNASIAGRLYSCGTYQKSPAGNGPHALQYTAMEDWTPVTRGSVPLAVLGREVVQKLDAAGWDLRSAPTPNPEHPAAATYAGQRDGLYMQVVELNANPGLGALVTVFISAKCFDAGSESASTKFTETYEEDIDEPSPAPTSGAS
jgi:hypothetical protein